MAVGSWGAGSKPGGAISSFFVLVVFFVFYPLACFCLFSLLTLYFSLRETFVI